MQLLCLGDVAIVEDEVVVGGWAPPAGLTPSDDVKILLNWEFPIGDALNPVPRTRGRRYLATDNALSFVKRWAPGFAALATNHILDGGKDGLRKTIRALRESGFTLVGGGENEQEIAQPLVWETAEGRLGIINWVFPETNPDLQSVPGPNCWPGYEQARQVIADLKQKTDWVLAIVHWSDEYFSYPTPEDRAMACELEKMGVDIIVGHHPHVVRGMETIGACPVFYSLGNFYFSNTPDKKTGTVSRQAPRNREGLGVLLTFKRGQRPAYQTLSFWRGEKETTLDPRGRAVMRFQNVSRRLQQDSASDYVRWYRVARPRFNQWEFRWHFRLRKLGAQAVLQFISRRVFGGR